MKLLHLSIHLICIIAISANSLPDVTTLTGRLQGYFSESINGKKYAAFEGIPYAKPPIGKLRFRDPEPLKEWKGIWQANTLYKCIQYYHYTEPGQDFVIGEEDCLYLNVYTPVNANKIHLDTNNKQNLLDVIIFIHGGAFMFNHGGTYGPKMLMDRNVVFVAMNYRLGPMGFLSTEDTIIPGNAGLKDQVLALRWIKENIKFFGGNPESITLTGMSAGGASVQFHTLSPLSKGLFHRAIIQSGTTLNPWVLVEKSLKKVERLALLLGCNKGKDKSEENIIGNSEVYPNYNVGSNLGEGTNTVDNTSTDNRSKINNSKDNNTLHYTKDSKYVKDMVSCIKRRPARQIVSAVKHFQPWLYNPFSPFGVVVDSGSENPMVPEHPLLMLKKKDVQDVPVIFSTVQSEGLYPAADFVGNKSILEELNAKWNELIPHILDYNNTVPVHKRDFISQKIRTFYFGSKGIGTNKFAAKSLDTNNTDLNNVDLKITDVKNTDFKNKSEPNNKSETKSKTVSKATAKNLIKMISDRMFFYNIKQAAKLHTDAISSKVYFYYFAYRGAHSRSAKRIGSNENYGSAHCDDTIYVLSTDVDMRSTEQDKLVSEMMIDIWTSFAKNSIPAVPNWEPLSKRNDSLNVLNINSASDVNMELIEDLGNSEFWLSLQFAENDKLFVKRDEL